MKAAYTRRRVLRVEVDETIFEIRGWQAHKMALGAGLKPIYSGVRGAWVADTKKLPQFVAYCEYRNVAVEVADDQVHRSTHLEVEHPDIEDVEDHDLQLPFGPGGGDAR